LADNASESSDLDGIVLEESSGPDEGSADLELDQFQATEIREIFLTTLPEYLEPVRQMLDQLFSPAGAQPEIREALETTLGSIHTAAVRVGIDDVAGAVDRMRAGILELGPDPTTADQARARISIELSEIERIASSVGAPAGTAARAETIVAALGRLTQVDKSVLQKLTAAGLVTVDQIRMADPGEIVAVSGLSADVVAEIVRALSEPPTEMAQFEPDTAGTPEARLAAKLETSLREQLELELAIERARGELLRARTGVAEHQHQIAAANERRESLRVALRDERAQIARRLARLAEVKAEEARLVREQESAKEHARLTRSRADTLEHDHTVALQECELLTKELTVLTLEMSGLLESARARSESDES
jgi:hypothetical protein